jgi:uncharacterized membrane protein
VETVYNSYESPTVLGIPEKWERVLCYALGWITGIVFLIIEQRNQNVRRHAVQSILVFGGLSLLGAIVGTLGGWLGAIILIGGLFHFLFGLLGFVIWGLTVVLWIVLLLMAYTRSDFFLPLGNTYRRLLG